MYSNAFYTTDSLTKKIDGIRIDINGVTMIVPLDPNNTDYANIMKLVEESKLVIAPAEETNNVN